MKLEKITQLVVNYEPSPERSMRVGRLVLQDRRVLFQYDAAFLGRGLELSPLRLRRTPDVITGDPALFDGLMGLFDDSLPDGWGRLLMDRRAAQLGLSSGALTPLDRLAIVGTRSMGALVYEPETTFEDPSVVRLAQLAEESIAVQQDAKGVDLERLIAVGGSPKGARPKVLIQINSDGDILLGSRDIRPGFSAWLVKFPAPSDDRHIAALEHAYFLMAKHSGILVPQTRLLGKTRSKPGYFAIERFDRDRNDRVHMHTLGGLLHLPHGYPALDYRDLLKVTREITRNEAAVTEMFRRACFNVFAFNRDDHSRNFAFVMDERGLWHPSPAYDLTYAEGPGGEHTMLVAGEGRNPGEPHLETLAKELGVRHGIKVIDQVKAAIERFTFHADEAGVPAKLRKTIASALGVAAR